MDRPGSERRRQGGRDGGVGLGRGVLCIVFAARSSLRRKWGRKRGKIKGAFPYIYFLRPAS